VEMKNIARSSSVPLNKLPLPPPRKPAGPSSGATVLLKSITPRNAVGTSGDDNTATKDSESTTVQADAGKGIFSSKYEDIIKGENNGSFGLLPLVTVLNMSATFVHMIQRKMVVFFFWLYNHILVLLNQLK
jgi:hypothetical protein